MKILAAATGLVTLMGAHAAAASCVTVEPVLVPSLRIDPLDATGAAELAQGVTLRFHRTDMTGGPLQLQYQIVDEDSSVVTRVGASEGPVVSWYSQETGREVGAGRNEGYPLLRSGAVRFDADEASAQGALIMRLMNLREDLAAGVYREQYTVRYWCGDDPTPFEQRGAIALTVAVPNVLSATLAGASARGEVDFLDFTTLRRALMVSVRSTGSYRVSARSLNGGVMVREAAGPSRDAADQIAYEVSFAGREMPVDGVTAMPMSRDGLAGRQHAFEVEVEDVRSKRAGDYADTIFLTLAPAN